MTVSVLTLAAGRAEHLANVVTGLCRQTQRPDELVIGVMQADPYDLPDTPFPVRQIHVTGPELPLAAARNAVARTATGDKLIFVDVDCIPAPSLVADYAARLEPGAGLFMGEVGYLPQGATQGDWDEASFEAVSVRHGDRQGPPPEGVRFCNDYRCFWSLNFAMHRDDWTASGGFDERYVGYGGEDTDFGKTIDEAGLKIWWLKGAKVHHQYHPHFMPPIHHVPSVVRNAELFKEKWGYRTMEHWLHAFKMMGLIEDTPEGIRILREPNEADLALCRQEGNMPYASTRRVLDYLNGRAARCEMAKLSPPVAAAG
ncbi:glycosyltransferase [Salipiger sp. IMCC34102]|uniref:glycosyltransferase family 2 protein n=1 Tax=Salipiger sp. IMCC34102 TaxID=2510647 RepID=UPI00101CA8CE|nr:galactosyltransferase-related protein [Salipiger sp. IMCC34102]RYH00767.1 glycosyltransferase [Salipiger sp. IMCC34102]